MYNLNWKITIGKYALKMLESVEILRSVEQLSDTATIVLPGSCFNKAIEIENKIKRGNAVEIKLGYSNNPVVEFTGYLESIATDDGSITLKCEDSLFTLRTAVNDKEFTSVGLSDILNYIVPEGISISCSYQFNFDKYVIKNQTAYQVLKKLQEETKANIYLKNQQLHIHSRYEEIFGNAKYSFQQNIEKSELEYKNADDRKVQVIVEAKGKDGKVIREMAGESGGDVINWNLNGVSDIETLRTMANEQLKIESYTGYSGDFTAWLEPYCDAGYSVDISDSDYEYKSGSYYVIEVTTKLSSAGGERKIKIGKKL